jgi:hypothetical protein
MEQNNAGNVGKKYLQIRKNKGIERTPKTRGTILAENSRSGKMSDDNAVKYWTNKPRI